MLDEGYSEEEIRKGIFNIDDVTVLKVIHRESYIYSSKKTIKYIGHYMQYIFKNIVSEDEEKEILEQRSLKAKKKYLKEKAKSPFTQLFLISKIISNMKYDFTGEKMSSMDLLKLKINDLDTKKKIRICILNIKYFIMTNYI